jgi:hypothetical protein
MAVSGSAAAPGRRSTPADATLAVALFLATFLIFKLSPNHLLYDSQFTMLLADNLLRHGDFDLERYKLPETITVDDQAQPQYRLEHVRGHVYYRFPPGSALLSIPYVAAMRAVGISVVRGDGSYDELADLRLNALLAGLVAAAFSVLLFFTARLLLPPGTSWLVATVAALGSQVYSSASRVLGSDTWGLVLVGALIFLLLRAAVRQRAPSGVLLATLASWGYVVRPTQSLVLVGTALYLALFGEVRGQIRGEARREARRVFGAYVVTCAMWLGLLVTYSWHHFAQILPGYFLVQRLGDGGFFVSLLGHLASPSRGLLVYAPAPVAGVLLALRYWKQLRYRGLARLALLVTVGHLLVIAHYRGWGGHGFGPRLSTGAIPWLMLLAILGLDAARTRTAKPVTPALLVAAAAACLVSIAINAVGAVSRDAALWNSWPLDVDRYPERVWDWRQPQFLAPLVKPPDYWVPIPAQGIEMGRSDVEAYLGAGWSYGERTFRWTKAPVAEVRFAKAAPLPHSRNGARQSERELELELAPLLVPGQIERQRVSVRLNARELWTADLTIAGFSPVLIPIPDGVLAERNRLTLQLPDAVIPPSERESGRKRQLGVAVRFIRWAAIPMIPDDGIPMARAEAAPFLRDGWSQPEGDFRWTDGDAAAIRFAGERPPPDAIELELRPYLVHGRIGRQHVDVVLNGREVGSVDAVAAPFERYVVPLPPGVVEAQNTLTLRLPDAASPRSLGESADERRLGIAVRAIRRNASHAIPAMEMASPEADRHLAAGWGGREGREGDLRWTVGPSATVTFVGENPAATAIEIELRPHLEAGKLARQRLRLLLDGRELWRGELTRSELARIVIAVPAGALHGENNLTFILPDATSPRALGSSADPRALGVAVRFIREVRRPW